MYDKSFISSQMDTCFVQYQLLMELLSPQEPKFLFILRHISELPSAAGDLIFIERL